MKTSPSHRLPVHSAARRAAAGLAASFALAAGIAPGAGALAATPPHAARTHAASPWVHHPALSAARPARLDLPSFRPGPHADRALLRDATAFACARRLDGLPIAPVIAIANASAATGADFRLLLVIASMESELGRYDTPISGEGSAQGLFQFQIPEWEKLFQWFAADYDHGQYAPLAARIEDDGNDSAIDDPAVKQRILDLRSDPGIAAYIKARQLLREGRPVLATMKLPHRGEPNTADYNIEHIFGIPRAREFFTRMAANKNSPAIDLFPAEATNPSNKAAFIDKRGRKRTLYGLYHYYQEASANIAVRIDTTIRNPGRGCAAATAQPI